MNEFSSFELKYYAILEKKIRNCILLFDDAYNKKTEFEISYTDSKTSIAHVVNEKIYIFIPNLLRFFENNVTSYDTDNSFINYFDLKCEDEFIKYVLAHEYAHLLCNSFHSSTHSREFYYQLINCYLFIKESNLLNPKFIIMTRVDFMKEFAQKAISSGKYFDSETIAEITGLSLFEVQEMETDYFEKLQFVPIVFGVNTKAIQLEERKFECKVNTLNNLLYAWYEKFKYPLTLNNLKRILNINHKEQLIEIFTNEYIESNDLRNKMKFDNISIEFNRMVELKLINLPDYTDIAQTVLDSAYHVNSNDSILNELLIESTNVCNEPAFEFGKFIIPESELIKINERFQYKTTCLQENFIYHQLVELIGAFEVFKTNGLPFDYDDLPAPFDIIQKNYVDGIEIPEIPVDLFTRKYWNKINPDNNLDSDKHIKLNSESDIRKAMHHIAKGTKAIFDTNSFLLLKEKHFFPINQLVIVKLMQAAENVLRNINSKKVE